MLLSSLAEAARRAAAFSAPARWDGCLASISAALIAICMQVRGRKTTASYYSKIIKIQRNIDRSKNSVYNDIS